MSKTAPTSEDLFAVLAARTSGMTVIEVSTCLQVSPKTIRSLIKTGDLRANRTPRGYSISSQALLGYLRQKSQPRFTVIK